MGNARDDSTADRLLGARLTDQFGGRSLQALPDRLRLFARLPFLRPDGLVASP